jgi:hypothetical protein
MTLMLWLQAWMGMWLSGIHDAANNKSSKELWEVFKVQREKELSMLLKELKNQIDTGMLALE